MSYQYAMEFQIFQEFIADFVYVRRKVVVCLLECLANIAEVCSGGLFSEHHGLWRTGSPS